MTLPLRDHPTLLASSAAYAQHICPDLTDLDDNSPFAALLNAGAFNATYLQYLALAVLAQTRLSTSQGEEVDTWLADFGLTRLPGIPAKGTVTFSRYTGTHEALIAPGTTIKTSDSTQTFTVYADAGNASWRPDLNAYRLGVGVAAINVPVEATSAGPSGNVKAQTITQITSSLTGVDSVSNAGAFSGGMAGEGDTAFKARFVRFINTLSKGTLDAIEFAVLNVQQNLSVKLVENRDLAGSVVMGMVSVHVDDGSGSLSSILVERIGAAVDKVRAGSIQTPVGAAKKVQANVVMTIEADTGYLPSALAPQVQSVVTAYINSLPVGADLDFHRLAHVAFDGVEGVRRVTDVTLNGTSDDLTINKLNGEVVRAGSVTVF